MYWLSLSTSETFQDLLRPLHGLAMNTGGRGHTEANRRGDREIQIRTQRRKSKDRYKEKERRTEMWIKTKSDNESEIDRAPCPGCVKSVNDRSFHVPDWYTIEPPINSWEEDE